MRRLIIKSEKNNVVYNSTYTSLAAVLCHDYHCIDLYSVGRLA